MKIGLLITTYNRPEYLRQCLASVKNADLSQVSCVLVVDDCSTDKETIRLINDFELDGVELIKAFSKENRSIKGSLLFGLDLLFNSCSLVTNLDGDAIVTRNFIDVLLKLDDKFPDCIKTGFCCYTKNKNGSERHLVLETGDTYTKRKSVGGINMMFDKIRYEKYVRPALIKSIEQNLNWDDHTCRASMADGKEIITTQPSIVQHIGYDSSMNHSAGGEPPDRADDFPAELEKLYAAIANVPPRGDYIPVESMRKHIMGNVQEFTMNDKADGKIYLPNVTLVAADCVDIDRIFEAAEKCQEKIEFASLKIFSSIRPQSTGFVYRDTFFIDPIKTKEEYSWWIMKELAKYITTSHVLIFQHDGYVLNPSAWDDEWLQYDYIGAPWHFGDPKHPVGNGGFSLRSKKLMDIVANHPDIYPMNEAGVSFQKEEDHVIARIFGEMLTKQYGIKFAPIEVAEKFSIEAYGVKPPGNKYNGQFGFHGSHVDFS